MLYWRIYASLGLNELNPYNHEILLASFSYQQSASLRWRRFYDGDVWLRPRHPSDGVRHPAHTRHRWCSDQFRRLVSDLATLDQTNDDQPRYLCCWWGHFNAWRRRGEGTAKGFGYDDVYVKVGHWKPRVVRMPTFVVIGKVGIMIILLDPLDSPFRIHSPLCGESDSKQRKLRCNFTTQRAGNAILGCLFYFFTPE